MGKFSSQEIEIQYNLIKMLLAEPEKYKDAIDAIKRDIAYMPLELKKNLRKKILPYESKTGFIRKFLLRFIFSLLI